MGEIQAGIGGPDQIPEELIQPDKEGYISIRDGMDFCGSIYSFVKFLKAFTKTIDDKAKEIENALSAEDYELYTIKVHALKSTSKIIGAYELSDMAKSLETAGEEGNHELIKEKTGDLLKLYRSYSSKLSEVLNISIDGYIPRLVASRETIEDAYSALREVVPMMDYDSAEMIISGLKKYKLSEEELGRIDNIEEALKALDWSLMETLIKK